MKALFRNSRMLAVVSTVFVVVALVVYGVPLLWMVLTSLKSATELAVGPAAVIFRPSLEAYRSLGSSVVVPVFRSVEIAGGTTVLSCGLAVLADYALSHVRGRVGNWIINIALAAFVLLQMVPEPTAVIPLYDVLAKLGLSNTILGVIFADTSLFLPMAVLVMRPFFLSIPPEVEEAAQVDGASSRQILGKLVIPLVMNGIFTVGTLVFMLSWGEFIYAVTFLNSSNLFPSSVSLALQVGLLSANWNSLMALAVIVSIPVLVLYIFSSKRLREGVAAGAIK